MGNMNNKDMNTEINNNIKNIDNTNNIYNNTKKEIIKKEEIIKKIQNDTDKDTNINNFYISDVSSENSFSSISCNSIDIELENDTKINNSRPTTKSITRKPKNPYLNNIIIQDNKNYKYYEDSFHLPRNVKKIQNNKKSKLLMNHKNNYIFSYDEDL
jgi:hypothetical protein